MLLNKLNHSQSHPKISDTMSQQKRDYKREHQSTDALIMQLGNPDAKKSQLDNSHAQPHMASLERNESNASLSFVNH